MFDIENFKKELSKYSMNIDTYEKVLADIDAKINGENDYDWSEIKDKYNVNCNPDTIRKSSTTPFGGKIRSEYERYKAQLNKDVSNDDDIDAKIQKLRDERIKLQTSNIEKNRIDRAVARQELYYEYVGSVIQALTPPQYNLLISNEQHEVNYVVGLADVHYGATYHSINNEYSTDEAKRRFEYLTSRLINFVEDKQITNLTIVSLGDLIQGVLRLSDLKINDSSIVKATVEVCRLIANMLNELSAYTNINYYHTPSANHTQIRVLNAKASELADEDLEYLMGNYIKDLCANNERITVFLADEGNDYIEIHVPNNEIIAMHGHQLKNVENAVKDISILHKKFYDTVLLGHYHNGKEIPSHEGILGDAEVLISPSFIGSDPYSDKICKGSKACVKIYGFDKLYGHTETYKIILN